MRLNRLSASGIHGRLSYSHTIDPVTVIIGANGAGKSSLVGIPRLVINGPSGATFPVLGASPEYDWESTVAFDSGPSIGRWMRGGKHASSYNGIGGTLKDVQTRIDGAVGRATTWSLDAFLGDSPSKRQAFLEAEVLRGAGWDVAKVWAALDAEGAPRATVEEVLTSGVVDPPDDDGRVLLTSVLAGLRDVGAAADADARRLLAVVRNDALEEAKVGGPGGTVATWRARVAELDASIAATRERRGEIAGRKAARDDLQRQLGEAERSLATHLETDWVERAVAAGQRRSAAVLECDAAKVALDSAAAAAAAAKAALAAGRADVDQKTSAAADARARIGVRALPGELPVNWEGFDVGERLVVVVHRASGHIRTDTASREGGLLCFGDDPDGSSFDPAVHALFDIGSLSAVAPTIERALVDAQAPILDLTPLAEAARLAEQERDALRVQVEAAARVEARASHAHAGAVSAHAGKVAAVTTANEAYVRIRAEQDSAATTEAGIRERIERLASEVGESLDGQVEAVADELEMMQDERGIAQANADALSDAAGAIAKRAENRASLDTAQTRRTKARELGAIVETVLSRMLGELVSPLEEPVSRITRAVLGADFRVVLDGGATFWLVWPDHKAPLAASRSEQAVAMMALRCAVQQHLHGWRHLVLDDMENLASNRRTQFVEAMLDEVREGRLDNFLGACVEDGWSPPAGAMTIRRSS